MLANFLTAFFAINFQPMEFVHNLYYMGMGMLCIILVMLVIIVATTLLNKAAIKLSGKKKDNDKE